MFHAPECDALTLVRRRRAVLERLASGGRTVGGRVSFYGGTPTRSGRTWMNMLRRRVAGMQRGDHGHLHIEVVEGGRRGT
jgi:hypothetical protein